MYLRTSLEAPSSPFQLGLDSSILTLGSCFSDFLGLKLEQNKFKCLSNPFGTVYNPLSMAKLLRHSMSPQAIPNHLFWENESVWHHHDYHAHWWASSREELEKKIESSHQQVHQYLRKTNVLVLTLGTAYVFKLKPNLSVISNCHKRPAKDFKKELLRPLEIVQSLSTLIDQLLVYNGKIKIILTVSPVRHIKETLQGNSVSKSILRYACHELVEKYTHVAYFPSFEIMMDDLRDYRFYQPDLIHPNEVALDHIFKVFGSTFFGEETQDWLSKWQKVHQNLMHRPQYPGSASHIRFLQQTKTHLENLHGPADLSEERIWVDQQLSQLA